MKIKNTSELANVLGRAFASYANQVENGAVAPYIAFLDGCKTVNVQVKLNDDGSINVTSFEPVVEELQPVLEAQSTEIVEAETVVCGSPDSVPEQAEIKPKTRKRKTQ